MKKSNRFMAVVLVFAFFMVLPVYAAEKEASKDAVMNESGFHAFEMKDLMGKTVKNQNGETLGKIEDAVVGEDGRVDYMVLSRGGLLGAGEKYVPIPFKTFMTNTTNMAKLNTDSDLIFKFDKAKLDSAPTFSDKKWDLSNKSWQNKVCSYYGAGACPYL